MTDTPGIAAARRPVPLSRRRVDWVLLAFWNGPFYVAAIYAIARGRDWIRVPALIWSGSMSAVVLMILAEEYSGAHRAPHFGFVLPLLPERAAISVFGRATAAALNSPGGQACAP